MNYPTHIIVTTRSQTKAAMFEVLFRADDGIAIGQRKGCVVIFGISQKTHESRVFVDEEAAARWLRGKVALDDLKARGFPDDAVPTFEEREGSALIVPDDSVQLPHPGIARMN